MQERPLKEVFDTVRIPVVGDTGIGYNAVRGNTEWGVPGMISINMVPARRRIPGTENFEWILENRPGLSTETGVDLTGKVNSTYDLLPLAVTSFATLVETNDQVVVFYDYSNDYIYVVQVNPGANTCKQLLALSTSGYAMNGAPTTYPYVSVTELVVAGVTNVGFTIWDVPGGQYGRGYYAAYDATSGYFNTLTQIASNFPTNLGTPKYITGGFVQMNGTTYIMTQDGGIYNSDLNAIATWDALGVIQATSYPDTGMGLVRYKHHILAFGAETVEFFNDVGTAAPASPLGRTDQAFIKLGTVSGRSFINISDTVYWISRNSMGRPNLYRLDGYTPVKMDLADVDGSLHTSGNGPAVLQALQIHGAMHLVTNLRRTFAALLTVADMAGDDDNPIIVAPEGILMIALEAGNLPWFFYITQDSMVSAATYDIMVTCGQTSPVQSYQFIWHGWSGPGATSGEGSSFNQNMGVLSDGPARAYDSYTAGNGTVGSTTSYVKMLVLVTTGWLDFGNEKRKRVHKLKLIMTEYDKGWYSTTVTEPVNTWKSENNYLYFLYNRRSTLQAYTSPTARASLFARYIDMDSTTNDVWRYYIPNCGSGRMWTLGFASYIYLPMKVKAFEVDMSQGF